MTHKYSVNLVWSREDAAFIATVNELPGCMADGVTREKALQAIDLVIAEWIETAKELGRPIPAPICNEDIEQMFKAYQVRLAEHIQREVESAVHRVLKELSPVFAGRIDPAESWKTCAD